MDETKDSTSSWKPIDTAPKDGSEVLLLYYHVSGHRYIVLGTWYDDGPYWVIDGDRELEEAGEATHWMLLPAIPPEEELSK
jgi:hypothetical protein